jgi:iron complex transport system ATP-binding protein
VSAGGAAPPATARLTAHRLTVRVKERALVEDVSLEVRAGEVLAIVGRNGAGKSTLLGALAGDRRPAAGEVRLDGAPLDRLGVEALARRRAVVRQRSELAAELTVHEVVALGDVWRHGPRQRALQVAAQLATVGLEGFAERRYPSLSGGERQRVHLARALLQLGEGGGGVLLLDEPTSALDPQQQHRMGALLRQVAARGVAVAVILHDLALAACYADRAAVLADGRLLACAAAGEALAPTVLRQAFGVEFEVVELASGLRCPIACPDGAGRRSRHITPAPAQQQCKAVGAAGSRGVGFDVAP